MKRLSEIYNAKPFSERYDILPARIMLDSNVAQYLLDFGGFIFEKEVEGDGGYLTTRRNTIRPGQRLSPTPSAPTAGSRPPGTT